MQLAAWRDSRWALDRCRGIGPARLKHHKRRLTATPRVVLVPAGLGTLDKSFRVEEVDWSTAPSGYVRARSKGKELTFPSSSILYVESD